MASCLNRRLKKPVSLSFVESSVVGFGEESDLVFVEESGVLLYLRLILGHEWSFITLGHLVFVGLSNRLMRWPIVQVNCVRRDRDFWAC